MPEPHTNNCPDPLCILDLNDHAVCQSCPKQPKPHPGWGGKRDGAGAPVFNLNRLVHGGQSKLLKRGVVRIAQDPELRGVFYIIARLASNGYLPPETRTLIQRIISTDVLGKKGGSHANN